MSCFSFDGLINLLFVLFLHQDPAYTQILTVPPTGLNLKTKIYVNVKATNLTDRYSKLNNLIKVTPMEKHKSNRNIKAT